MFIALDKNSKRVSVWDSQKNQTYYCPVCNSELIIKDGKINEKHFAHKKACSDTWNYDMSYWHQKMQNYFPEHQREVVVSNRFGTHRADILIENTVIEFQHSKITAEEYQNRTNFFIRSGYRIAWVFDLSEQRECGYLQYKQDIDDNCDYSLMYEDILKYGVCSEYCLIQGDFEQGAMWGEKYKNAVKIGWYMCKAKELQNG